MGGLSSAEFAVWRDYYRRHGYPADRAEWGAAIAGEYVGWTMGGKARASALVPKFGRADDNAAGVRAWFDSLAGKPATS